MSDTLQQHLQVSLGAAFTIERELGGGGMSRVFLAEETRFHRRVVIKVLASGLAEGLNVERFEREIALAAALQQANIVPVITAGDVDGLPWYSMPYVDGESLRARLNASRPTSVASLERSLRDESTPVRPSLTSQEAVAILRDVARALRYAHEHGIVHRDIKPENVLLSGDAAVVIDFGIAKALSASKTQVEAPGATLTQVGTSLGTPAYMAPEQAAADPDTDHRADIYAWGVMAYELLAGRHPFAGKTSPHQLMSAHLGETPAPLPASGSSASRPMRAIVMQCLEKDPARRPASAAELVAALSGQMTTARASLAWRQPVAIAAAVIAIIATGAVWWRSRPGIVRTAEAAAPIRLAVLPFDNEGSPEQAVFTNALTDAVTARLGGLPMLAVIDRHSAAQYRQTSKPTALIGTELGVQYLVEGVVRWAKDAKGAWRAQVTPALVDAKAGTTRWTGEPVVFTPDDPFAAQGTIATTVADALQLALRPTDRAGLTRRLTDNPEAFAAYERGRAIEAGAERAATSLRDWQRAAVELERAVTLDSTFTDAWGELAAIEATIASMMPDDRAAVVRLRAVNARALRQAPNHPFLLLSLLSQRLMFEHDTTGADALIDRVIAGAPSDSRALSIVVQFLAARQRFDSAYAMARKAASLDPRSPQPLFLAAYQALFMRRWDDALRYSNALIALDSADERGWSQRAAIAYYRGDTLGMQRELTRALAHFPHASNMLLSRMAYAGAEFERRYVTLSARDLGISTLNDSIGYYLDSKADVYIRLGDRARALAYSDSIRRLLSGRSLSGPTEPVLRAYLAFAQANLGQVVEARRTLQRTLAAATALSPRPVPIDVLDVGTMAGIYARIGEPETAVQWLEAALANPAGGVTARSLAIEPKVQALRGTQAFERFLAKHAQ